MVSFICSDKLNERRNTMVTLISGIGIAVTTFFVAVFGAIGGAIYLIVK